MPGGARRIGTALALALALTLAAGCSSDETATAPTTSSGTGANATTAAVSVERPEVDVAALQAAFDEWAAAADGGGVAALRVGAGDLITLATGRDPDTRAPLEPDTPVRVGSISKTLVATMVLALVEDGRVDLDASLGTYLPDSTHGFDVTIRQLLGHRSGIPNYTESALFLEAMSGRPDRVATSEEVLSFVDATEQQFEPGSQFRYSNTNYILLGRLIEESTGSSIGDALRTMITDPLGMELTSFDDGSRPDVAGGFTAAFPGGRTGAQSYSSVASSAWTAGSLVTTAGELAAFLDALFAGEIVDDELVAEMQRSDDDDGYGLGLHRGPTFGVGHGGSIVGFNSTMQLDPATGDLLIVVVNNDQRNPAVAEAALWSTAKPTG